MEPDCVSCPRLGSHRISLLPCAPRVCQVSCPARGRGPSPRGTEQASRSEESRSCGAVCGTHISPRAPEPAQAAGGHCPHPHSGSGHHLGTVRLMAGRTGQTLLEGPGPPPSGSETLVLPARSRLDPKCPGRAGRSSGPSDGETAGPRGRPARLPHPPKGFDKWRDRPAESGAPHCRDAPGRLIVRSLRKSPETGLRHPLGGVAEGTLTQLEIKSLLLPPALP